jgi:hypothetical protein
LTSFHEKGNKRPFPNKMGPKPEFRRRRKSVKIELL